MPNEYGTGLYRDITLATETTYSVQANGPGQLLRRTNFSGELNQPQIASTEISQDGQLRHATLGMPGVAASLSGELSPGSYKSLFASALRSSWTTGVNSGAESTFSLAIAGGTGIPTLTYGGGNFLTDGFKRGDVVRFSGLTSTPAALNGINLFTTAVTSTTITFAPNAAAVAWSAATQAAATLTVVGKKLFIPTRSNQAPVFFSIEDWQADKELSRLFLGCTVGQISMSVAPNGAVSFQTALTGRRVVEAGARVYGSPTAAATTAPVQGVTGKILYQGTMIGYIPSFSLQISQALQPAMVIDGLSGPPMIAGGMITAQGSIQALLEDDTITADFLAQNDLDLALHLPTNALGTADFVNIFLPRARLASPGNRQDSDRLLVRSYTLMGLQKTSGGAGTAYDATTIVIQDSQA